MKIYAKDHFKVARLMQGFSVIALAEELEMSRQAINQIEKGVHGISPAKAKQATEILNAKFGDIFKLVEREQSNV